MDRLSALYLRIAQTSISSLCYAGNDVRYSTDFEALETHLKGEQSMHGAGHVDWDKVRELSERILREQSKDLRVACWLVWALYKCEAFPGLLAGMELLLHICKHHWPVLYPIKSGTRTAAFAWLVSRLEKVLVEEVSVKKQLSLFERLSVHLEVLDELLGLHFGEASPLLLPLRRRLDRMLKLASQDESKPMAIVTQVKEVATQLFSPAPVGNDKEARKALGTQQELARALCAWWLRQKATDPRALRLNRTLLWLTIESAPDCNGERITALRGLPADRLNDYKGRFEQGKYADLVVDIEMSIARSPFWFDGQRMVWECFEALQAQGAMREVEIQFALFLQRVSGIADLHFYDGQPFADEATQSWIATHVMPHVTPEQSERSSANASVGTVWNVVSDEVAEALPKTGFKQAVQVLMQHLKEARNARERFFWQFAVARLCCRAKKFELARVQLELLDQQLQNAGLEHWEFDTFLEVSQLLYSCYELLPPTQETRVSKEALYRRLCQYDFESVLSKS